MRTHSLYLSTLTGQNAISANIPPAISFTGTIVGTTLTLTAVASANIPTGTFFYNETLKWITGGSGTAINAVYTVGVSMSATGVTFTSTPAFNISATSAAIGLTQTIMINNSIYTISNIGALIDGNGYYLLTPTPTANGTVQTYYISPLGINPPKYTPTNKSSLSQVKWNINWREIFGNRIGECRVRARLISQS